MTYKVLENSYGHLKRLNWISKRISKNQTVCEIGCGTGAMLVLPLVQSGVKAVGIDTDEKSILYGKELFRKHQVAPAVFTPQEFSHISDRFDVIIVSEVLEHLTNPEHVDFFKLIRSKLKNGGKLFVTVPNGYGWFELESFLYFKKNVGKWIQKFKINHRIDQVKNLVLRKTDWVNTEPSTFCHSPHVQRFTYNSIQKLLENQGFEVTQKSGSVLFAGPFSDLLFAGFNPILKINNFLGTLFPAIASGFYLECREKGHE